MVRGIFIQGKFGPYGFFGNVAGMVPQNQKIILMVLVINKPNTKWTIFIQLNPTNKPYNPTNKTNPFIPSPGPSPLQAQNQI